MKFKIKRYTSTSFFLPYPDKHQLDIFRIRFKKNLITYLLVIILCFAGKINAQQLYFNHLTVNNGLSQGVNKCIYRDSRGFIWISSYDGLNRFDGLSCINFRSSVNEKNGLKGTLFLNILEDTNSDLWIGSNAGLNYYNRKLDQFQNFRIPDQNNSERFNNPFYIDDKKNIWLQSGTNIYIFNTENWTFKLIDHFFSTGTINLQPSSTELFQPLNGIIAINNNLPVLWKGEIANNEITWNSIPLFISSNIINTLLFAGDDDYWLGTNDGVYRYNNNQISPCINNFGDQKIKNVSALHLDQSGTLWVGTMQQGIFSIDIKTRIVNNQYTNSAYNNYGLSCNQIQFIKTDNKGDLWVSAWGKGVDYTCLNKFRFNQHVTKEQAVQAGTDNFIRSIIQVNDEFWCGTQSSGILILDENKKIKSYIRDGLPASIEHLCIGKDQQVWVASISGLFLVDPIQKKALRLPENQIGFGPASNQYNFISIFPDGSVLASTNAGIFHVKRIKNNYQFKLLKGIPNNEKVFLTTYIDNLSNLYISQAFKGFSVYRFAGDSLIIEKEFPMEETIKCFREQADSNLWIGTTIGLIQYNKYKFKIEKLITTNEGLSNQYIYGIETDGDYLWLSTNSGINRYNTKDYQVKTFSTDDGLQSNEYNTYSFCKTKNGEILFGGVNGLNSFFPNKLERNSFSPQLILIGLQLNDTSFKAGINQSEIRNLQVDYTNNTIGFKFAVIHYANSAANTLSYILEGYDKTWITASSQSLIRYANLPPGSYTLKVKAFNADGIEADSVYSLPLTVKTPWWLSWWFRILIILAAAGIITFIFKTYINKRLEKQRIELEKKQAVEKERNRISRDMHDDLGSGLTTIAILSEVVKKQISDPVKAKESLEKIAVSSRDLIDNLQDIIWVLNPKNDTLENLSSYIREYGLKFFEPFSVDLEFSYPDQFIKTHLSDELRRNIFLTVKESFNNIAKYAWCNKVTIIIHETKTEIQLIIHDDGKGFSMNNVRLFANGLKNMQNRIEQVGGSYSINSAPDKGTLTEIKFPN